MLYLVVVLHILSLCSGMSMVANAATWQMKQRDMHNTGRADYTVPTCMLDESFFDVFLWQKPLPGPMGATSMTFYDGAGPGGADIAVATYHWPKGVQAVDRHTGELFWNGNPAGGETIARIVPAFSNDGGTIYVVNDYAGTPPHHPLMAMQSTVGPSVIWHNGSNADPQHLSRQSPTISPDGRIFLHGWYDRPYAGTDSGSAITETWAAATDGTGCLYSDSALYMDGSDLKVAITGRNGWVICYDGSTGAELWKVSTSITTDASITIDPANGNMYVCVGDNDISVVGLDKDGNALWSGVAMLIYDWIDGSNNRQRAQTTGCLSHDGATYYFQTNSAEGDGCLYAVNTSDGSLKWSYNTNSEGWEIHSSSPIVTQNNVIVVGNNEGGVYYAIEDGGTAGMLLDTFATVHTGDASQCRAYASATISPEGYLYLPMRTIWTTTNGDGETPDDTERNLFVAFDLRGNELHVGPSQTYATIQAAVNAASEGDVVVVHENTSEPDYTENIIINTAGIAIVPAEADDISIYASTGNVIKITADNVDVSDFTITCGGATDSAVKLDQADDCHIFDNTISDAYIGIELVGASDNTITSNIVTGNGCGICLASSSNNNVVYLNNFDNTTNVTSTDSTNTWNSPLQRGYNYQSNFYMNYMGNYWSDYSGSDTSPVDGIGDSPYPIANDNDDGYPLMATSGNYEYVEPVINTDSGEEFPTVQQAVDDAETLDGHTIIILPGTYLENVNINKELTIESASGEPNDTIIEAVNADDHVFEITADNVTIKNLSFFGATDNNYAGIYLYDANDCTIENNHCGFGGEQNSCGIFLEESTNTDVLQNICNDNNRYGIRLLYSDDNEITYNICNNDSSCGTSLVHSDHCTVSHNNFSNNGNGMYATYSNHAVISYNEANGNIGNGFRLYGSYSNPSTNFIVSGNTANSNRNSSDGIWVNYLSNSTFSGNDCCDNERAGLHVEHSSVITISGNTLDRNLQDGIYMEHVDDSTISGNDINENGNDYHERAGIRLEGGCEGNQFSGNTVSNNSTGFYAHWYNNTLTGNTFTGNDYNIGFGVNIYVNDVDTTNTVDGKPVYFLVDKHYQVIPADAGFVALVNCSNIIVRDLNLSNNIHSVVLAYTTDSIVENVTVTNSIYAIQTRSAQYNTIANCSCTNNTEGIYLYDGSNHNLLYGNNCSNNTSRGIHLENSSNENTLYGNTLNENYYGIYSKWSSRYNNIIANTFNQNSYYGAYFYLSGDNVLYLNNFTANTSGHVYSNNSLNTWSSPGQLTYIYNGSTYTNHLGNYWDNYGGSDSDGDGVGETSYNVPYDSNDDEYPLIVANGAFLSDVDVSVGLQDDGRPDPAGWEVPLTVEFYSPGADILNDDPCWVFVGATEKLGDSAVITIPAVLCGNYDITARSNHTLTNVRRATTVLLPNTSVDLGTLLEGNADNDQAISLSDHALLSTCWQSLVSDLDFNHNADFNRDGQIDILDLYLMVSNWLESDPVEIP